jgi:uncharacterized membrane protein
MQDLIVVGFQGTRRASEVLGQLQALNEDWTIDLNDAVAVYRTDDGKLRIDQSVQPTSKEGGAMGGLLGGLLGALIAAPFTAGVSAAAAAAVVGVGALGFGSVGALAGADDAADWKEDYGVPEDFVKQVGGMVQPGSSAVFAVIRTGDPVAIAERFRGYGGTVLRTSLTPQQAAKVQQTISSQQRAATAT